MSDTTINEAIQTGQERTERLQQAVIELRQALAAVSLPEDLGACIAAEAQPAPVLPTVVQSLNDTNDRLHSLFCQVRTIIDLLRINPSAKQDAERAFFIDGDGR